MPAIFNLGAKCAVGIKVLRIALISFEYPPAVAIGGIGAYALEAAKMLAKGGVDLEVFSAGVEGTTTCAAAGVSVHRVAASNRGEFSERIAPVVLRRHRLRPFDVLESPEIGAEGSGVAVAAPEIARVVKLHTPGYLVGKSAYDVPTFGEQARFSLGALRRGRFAILRRPAYDRQSDPEYLFTRSADEIAAPSRAIGEIVQEDWNLPRERVNCFPYPFLPNPGLLALPLAGEAKTIGFLGRLEARKGIIELAEAIPRILGQAPHLRFRFIGPSWPFKKGDMQSWMESRLARWRSALEFAGAVKPADLPEQLTKCDIMVLPSRWENFPFACIESMAGGRAVIGSMAGGMAEMIEPGKTGLLVAPRSPEAIVEAVLALVKTPGRVGQFAAAGREAIVAKLAPERVLPLQMASYQRAIAQAQKRLAAIQ